jgi:NADH:ubiquinone oxidoreductase subunit
MKRFLLQFFTWWNGQTLGTRFFTWRKGTKVGEDKNGNVYYQGDTFDNRPRRWVIYSGISDASAIPAGWHGWMHHRTDVSPAEDTYMPKEWELEHQLNPTGSSKAYRPKSLRTADACLDDKQYEAWTPNA